MVFPNTGTPKTATVLIALTVMVSVVTVGVVAQPNSRSANSSGEGTEPEPNDTMVNAAPIEYGSEINATLSSPNDTYYVQVVRGAGERLPHVEYNLTVSSPGADSDTGDVENATPIQYEQDVVITLSAGEEDWYAVEGHAGRKCPTAVGSSPVTGSSNAATGHGSIQWTF